MILKVGQEEPAACPDTSGMSEDELTIAQAANKLYEEDDYPTVYLYEVYLEILGMSEDEIRQVIAESKFIHATQYPDGDAISHCPDSAMYTIYPEA